MAESRRKFKTELKQLMDIIVHSLYSHREVFLREIVSNAADAVDKIRFEALTDASLGETDWSIRVTPDAKAGTLTISDNGIGMSRDTIIEDLGTIARSGTKAFLARAREAQAAGTPELIGQFGVGFYSSFMVADKVTVISRTVGDAPAVRWNSDGQEGYSVGDATRDARGTDVILHVRDDAREYLDPHRLRAIINRFSTFIEYPIVLVTTEEKDGETEVKEETVNDQKAIWLRPKQDIDEAEYNAFYKHIARDFEDPLRTIHYVAEGALEFRALLYMPKRKPFDFFMREPKARLNLYVKRVFITDACEQLLPAYLRFTVGLVDCADLPLNVSREMLQDNPMLAKIQKSLVSKVIGELADLLDKDREDYKTFYDEFGVTLKEGVARDYANREKLAGLLLFETARGESGKPVTLDEYVAQMPEDQKAILYLCGDSVDVLRHAPYAEQARDRGHDVLLMQDSIDPFVVAELGTYKDKPLQALDQGEQEGDAIAQSVQDAYAPLIKALQDSLADAVKDVRLSTRLKTSAACLVSDADQMNAHMERLMQQMTGRQAEAPPRVLELNPEHPVVRGMQSLHAADPVDAGIALRARLLLDQATVAAGLPVKDPAAFAERVNSLLVTDRACG